MFKKLKNLKKEDGFSIAEMMVVISITVLLSTLAIGYNKSSERQLRVYRDQSTIVATLNRAKALALERFNESPTDREVCGVGIYFEKPQTFILFQDSVNTSIGETCDDNSDYLYSGPSEDIEQFSLGSQVEFDSSMAENLEILFIPPHLDAMTTEVFPIEIPLKAVAESNTSVTIGVSAVGQVTTQTVN